MCLRHCVHHGLRGFRGGRRIRRKIQIQKQNTHGQIVQVCARVLARGISDGYESPNESGDWRHKELPGDDPCAAITGG